MKYLIFSPLFIFYFVNQICVAQVAGDLDISFGTDGITFTDFGPNPGGLYSTDSPYGIAVQSDGKIVAAGTALTDETRVFALSRYFLDGTIDSSFGFNGLVKAGTEIGFPIQMVLQPDDKILLAASINSDGGVMRLNMNGDIDSSFGVDGLVTTDIDTNYDVFYALALQNDGNILAGGSTIRDYTDDHDFILCKYLSDGKLDTAFANEGIFRLDLGLDETIKTINVLPDNSILIGGYSYQLLEEDGELNEYADLIITKLFSNGNIDSSFGINGIVTITLDYYVIFPQRILLLPDQSFYCAAFLFANSGNYCDMGLFKINPDGSLDNSFSTDGVVIPYFEEIFTVLNDAVLQTDGKIILVGDTDSDDGEDVALVRYGPDGTIDSSFNYDGIAKTDVNGRYNRGNAICLQVDGKILVVASAPDGEGGSDFAVLRFLNEDVVNIQTYSNEFMQVEAFPNPAVKNIILKLNLSKPEIVSIYLTDIMGNKIKTLETEKLIASGVNEQLISFPEKLSPGNYFIIIQTPEGKTSVQIIKD